MPVVYITGDGSYYVSDDGLGHTNKTKIGGIDPTQEPGYVRQSSSSNTSSTSSTSQNFSDPRALDIQEKQVDSQISTAKQSHDLAVKAQNFTEAKYWQDRIDTLQSKKDDYAFQREQRVGQQDFTRGENALNRGDTAIDRALRASEFASTFGLQQQQEQQAVAQANEANARQDRQDALDAAAQYAKQVSLTDPAALPAFLMAGGGNAANAIHAGATALTDNALLPAARTLNTIEHPVTHTPFSYNPVEFDPNRYISPFAASIAPPPNINPALATLNARGLDGRGMPLPTQTAAPASAAPAPTADQQARQQANAAGDAQWAGAGGLPSFVTRFAFGTGPVEGGGQLLTGDATDPNNPAAGGAHPEIVDVNDPTHDSTTTVTPLTPPGTGDTGMPEVERFAALFRSIADFLSPGQLPMPPQLNAPRFAYGTDVPDPTQTAATPDDQPYIDRVRAFRTGIQEPSLFPGQVGDQTMNAAFSRQPSAIQNRVAGVRQDVYGIPSDVTLEQAQQYQINGISPHSLQFSR